MYFDIKIRISLIPSTRINLMVLIYLFCSRGYSSWQHLSICLSTLDLSSLAIIIEVRKWLYVSLSFNIHRFSAFPLYMRHVWNKKIIKTHLWWMENSREKYQEKKSSRSKLVSYYYNYRFLFSILAVLIDIHHQMCFVTNCQSNSYMYRGFIHCHDSLFQS